MFSKLCKQYCIDKWQLIKPNLSKRIVFHYIFGGNANAEKQFSTYLGQHFLLFVLRDFFLKKIESRGGGKIKIKIKSTFWLSRPK